MAACSPSGLPDPGASLRAAAAPRLILLDVTADRLWRPHPHMIRAVSESASDRCLRGPDPELELRVETRLPATSRRGPGRRCSSTAPAFTAGARSGGSSSRPAAPPSRATRPHAPRGHPPDPAPVRGPVGPGARGRRERRSELPQLPQRLLGHAPDRDAGERRPRGRSAGHASPDGSAVDVPIGEIQVVPAAGAGSEGDRARGGGAGPESGSPWRPTTPTSSSSAPRSSRSGADPADWICVVSDDCSPPRGLRADAGDRRRRRALRPSPLDSAARLLPELRAGARAAARTSRLVALSDQDDRWYPDKLATLVDAIGDANLVYSDQRIVDSDGRASSPRPYWTERRQQLRQPGLAADRQHGHRRRLALPPRPARAGAAVPASRPASSTTTTGSALVALASGRIAYVDRPLYDYVQHGGAALGHAAAATDAGNRPRPGRGDACCGSAHWRGRARLAGRLLLRPTPPPAARPGPADALRRSARRRARADALRAAASQRALAGVDRSGWRRARRAPGSGRPETGGAEQILLQGIVWRHVQRMLALGSKRPPPGQPLEAPHDASLPPLDVRAAQPGRGSRLTRSSGSSPASSSRSSSSISERAPHRVNLLVPTIELKHLFGGYIAKFNLARKLAEQGLRTRIVTVDPTPHLPLDWRRAGRVLRGARRPVRPGRGRVRPRRGRAAGGQPGRSLRRDHLVDRAHRRDVRSRRARRRALRLPDPGVRAVHARDGLVGGARDGELRASRTTPCSRPSCCGSSSRATATASSPRARRPGGATRVSFQNAITPVDAAVRRRSSRRGSGRRLLFYARPEPHATRNMFELGLMASRGRSHAAPSARTGVFQGIGTVEGWDRIAARAGARARAAHPPRPVRLRRACSRATTSACR